MKVWYEVYMVREGENFGVMGVFETIEEAKNLIREYENMDTWFGLEGFEYYINIA